MLHARNDYNRRIQDSENVIPNDEPVFVLRGQDIFAPIILDLYATMAETSKKPDAEIVRAVREHAACMRQWQSLHGCKHADMHSKDAVY